MPAFTHDLRLKAPKRGEAPFDLDELERLWVAYANHEPVYLHSTRFAVETGARLGEIAALDWHNVDIVNGRVRIEATWDAVNGQLVAPKDGEARVVYLTSHARAALEAWVAVVGVHETGPVFPNPLGGGRITPRLVQRKPTVAMASAGIPKLHPDLEVWLPRSFHSFRYTTSVLMQQRGLHVRFVEQSLGHSTIELSLNVYGGWQPQQLAAEAARVPIEDGGGTV